MSYDLCRDRTDGTVDGEPGGTAGLRSGGARGQLLVGGQGAGTHPLGGQQADRAAGGPTGGAPLQPHHAPPEPRSEEHTSELQSLMRISYAVFCLKKKKKTTRTH